MGGNGKLFEGYCRYKTSLTYSSCVYTCTCNVHVDNVHQLRVVQSLYKLWLVFISSQTQPALLLCLLHVLVLVIFCYTTYHVAT